MSYKDVLDQNIVDAAGQVAHVQYLLEQLGAIRQTVWELGADIDAIVTKSLPVEAAAQIERLKKDIAGLEKRSVELEELITKETLMIGATVKGDQLQAIMMPGRVSWDSKLLDGYRVAHPEIEQFRTVGKPTVQIRKTKS